MINFFEENLQDVELPDYWKWYPDYPFELDYLTWFDERW